ncbi:methyltransferase family protein [Hydrogenispora ethanolica]|uniref:Arsenite methyltransferase n=1 Tax=Hydrogenispora ethanolica TaxID=1082276 RepID=A0A4R1RKP0_HYDET|nr:arsenite methyltransferase [Hydrogenispora ethanolica]TCL66589.1 methyltransferase family protein [Hydrogenispora ethanolica]
MSFEVRQKVKEHYGNIAAKVNQNQGAGCGCGSGSCCEILDDPMSIYDAEYLKNLPKAAIQASLGCANPLVFAELKEGETIIDLGSGGGIDVLMAAKYVGPAGKVFGLDMTDEMLALANRNKERMGVTNVEFLKGYIEEIPLPDKSMDAVISNCVINLSEDKARVFAEIYRVLKPGGRVAIADIVTLKAIPERYRKQAEMWVSCLAGTLTVDKYQAIMTKVGFQKIEITPVHIYTKSVMESLLEENPQLRQGGETIDLAVIDGAFAGAQIKAWKEGE